ncbi:hypothetical protein ACROYT_G011009 [Oculina patagonica]
MAKQDDKTKLVLKILVVLLALLSLALLIALIVVATKDKSEPVENGSSSGVKEFCPETTELTPPATVRSRGLYDDLSREEIIAVRDYILDKSSLNVTPYEDAAINNNYIYLIELQQPPKDEALNFLDNDNAQKPERKARVVIYCGGQVNPKVREYLVRPAGNPTDHEETTGPGQKYPIPFNTRFADPKELALMEKMLKNVTKHANRLLYESYDGYTFWNCTDRCLTWGLSAPSTFKANQRKQWIWFMRNLIGFYIHPVGFEVLLDTGGNDPSRWTVDKLYYNNATYDTVEELMNAYDSGSKMVFEAPKDKGVFSTYKRRGDPQPTKPLRNPQIFEPDGKRYTVSGRHVEYMGWSFDFRSRTSSGIQIFNIKFKGDTIVYELSVQEAEAFYSGWSPKPLHTNYLDAAWNMGSMTFELLRGVDCPNTATFFDVIHFVGRKDPAKYKNAICLFEQDMGVPLRRHYDTNFNGGYNFYGGMPGSALILRTVATTYNYDYVFDYIFYPNGVMEVRSSASGFPQTSFYTVDEEPYSNQIHPKMAGSLHDHIFNYKVDIDVFGTKQSYETIEVGLQNITNPWFPEDYHLQKVLHRRLHKNETEAVYHYTFDKPTCMNFFNKDNVNSYGLHRGYRVQIRDMMKQMYPESWPVVRGAAWSLNQMTVTKQKDKEEKSSSIYNQQDMVDPVLDFSQYVDGENIEDEDLVAWVTMGMMHIPHSEDIPNTATPGSSASFLLRPFNYFDEDPSMASYDGVLIMPSDDGPQIDTFGTPTKPACAPREKPVEFYGLYGDY